MTGLFCRQGSGCGFEEGSSRKRRPFSLFPFRGAASAAACDVKDRTLPYWRAFHKP